MSEFNAGYKPGNVPLRETDNRKLFCIFHYKGVLTLLIPILLGPILIGHPVMIFRFIYITVCLYLFFVLNLIPKGALSFIYVVLAPLTGIAHSNNVCMAYYTDLLFMVYGCNFAAIMMDSSGLSQHLGFIVIRIIGSNIKLLQLFLTGGVFLVSYFVDPSAAAFFWIKVAQAVVVEYDAGGVVKKYSDEMRFELGEPYPSRPVIGIYLTCCFTASLAAGVSPFVNPNGVLIDTFPGPLKIERVMLIMLIPVLLGICVTIVWIQTLFLGLLDVSVKREQRELADSQTNFQQSVKDRKEALGPWKIHAILSLIMILLGFVLLHTRKPRLYTGWDGITSRTLSGLSIPSIGLMILFTAIPASYLFCRYYSCGEPEKQGPAPPLLSWKAVNKKTPWGDILMLGGSFCCVYCAKESGFYAAVADVMAGPKRGDFLQILCGVCFGTLFTTLSPGSAVGQAALPLMAKASGNFAFATALHNQFLLPTSSGANTIVAGIGNVRPFQFLLAGIVPTLFMMFMITTFTWTFFDSAI